MDVFLGSPKNVQVFTRLFLFSKDVRLPFRLIRSLFQIISSVLPHTFGLDSTATSSFLNKHRDT